MLKWSESSALVDGLSAFSQSLPDYDRASLDRLLFLGLSGHDQLTLLPPDAILAPDEIAAFEAAKARVKPNKKAKIHSLVVILKATRRCNLRCTYCRAWRGDDSHDMSFEVLAEIMAQTLTLPSLKHVEFIWHGGEVTLLESAFFLKAMFLQSRIKQSGTRIHNSIQTNGVRISEPLLQLFRHYGFSVGVSIDAPRQLHDSLRLNRAGRPTWDKVRLGIEAMRAKKLPLALLCVVGPKTVKLGAEALLKDLAALNVRDVGLLNMVPENGCECRATADSFIEWREYLNFMTEVYTLWQNRFADRLVLRELDDLHRSLQGGRPTLCYFAGNCAGHYLTFEPDGRVAACDKYVGLPEFDFGSLKDRSLLDLFRQSSNLKSAKSDIEDGMSEMSGCRWYGICQGGCPHDRRLTQVLRTAEPDCCGYAPLLEHIAAHQKAAQT